MGYSFSNFYYPCFQILVSVSVQSWFQLIVLLIMENSANVFLLLCMSSNLWLNVRHLECYLVGYWIFSYSHILENCSRIDKLFRNSLNPSVLLLWSVCDVQSNVCVCVFSHVWLCDPMDCSLPGSSVYGIFQARTLERVAISYSREMDLPDPGIEPMSPVLQLTGSSIFIATCRIFSCGVRTLSCGMQDLVLGPEIESGLPALGE